VVLREVSILEADKVKVGRLRRHGRVIGLAFDKAAAATLETAATLGESSQSQDCEGGGGAQ
jgi:hypothetical protein